MKSPIRGTLPARPSLENLRNQARTLQKLHRQNVDDAVARVAEVLTRPALPLKLHDAQFVVAREYGFASWPKLVEELQARKPADRVLRENGRVWIDGVPHLRWGASPEPTYIGALEAALRAADHALDVTNLMGDSGLAFRLRWATRDNGQSWCGSGPCGEWPEEVDALNASTGYVYVWGEPGKTRPISAEHRRRITEHIDRGWPILALGLQFDMAVVYGYEAAGERILLSDYWATEEPCVLPTADAKDVGMFLERLDPPAPRATSVRAGLTLAVRRWHQGIVDADPITGATYAYGAAGYTRWRSDLERASALDDEQRRSLFFLNSWTYSALHQSRRKHAAAYLRENAEHLPEAAQPDLEAAAHWYDTTAERLGPWNAADPVFGYVKQKGLDTWTAEVKAQEISLLAKLHESEEQAMAHIERALRSIP